MDKLTEKSRSPAAGGRSDARNRLREDIRCGFILFTCGAEGGKRHPASNRVRKPNIGFAVIFLLAFILSAHSYTCL